MPTDRVLAEFDHRAFARAGRGENINASEVKEWRGGRWRYAADCAGPCVSMAFQQPCDPPPRPWGMDENGAQGGQLPHHALESGVIGFHSLVDDLAASRVSVLTKGDDEIPSRLCSAVVKDGRPGFEAAVQQEAQVVHVA
jgi:hypothetical protein